MLSNSTLADQRATGPSLQFWMLNEFGQYALVNTSPVHMQNSNSNDGSPMLLMYELPGPIDVHVDEVVSFVQNPMTARNTLHLLLFHERGPLGKFGTSAPTDTIKNFIFQPLRNSSSYPMLAVETSNGYYYVNNYSVIKW